MTRRSLFSAVLLVALLPDAKGLLTLRPAQSATPGPSRGHLTTGSFAIRNVTVIPMAGRTTIAAATVLVRDGRIAAVGPTPSTTVPNGVRVIDGTGKFLIPGLTDTHTHLLSDGAEVHDSAGPAELGVMLATGVTGARLMIGTPEQLALRAAVAEGKVTGPQLWVASPQLTGRPSENAIVVTTPDEARAAVKGAVEAGYDFIKLTMYINRPVYDAVVAEAKARGIRVVGHVEPQVGLAPAIAANQQLEHLDTFIEEALKADAPSRLSVTQGGVFQSAPWVTLDFVDNRKLDSLAGVVARAGIFIGPTQNVFNTAFGIGETRAQLEDRPDWAFWPPRMRQGYLNAHARYWDPARAGEKTEARRRRYVEIRNRLVKAIQDSGGKLIAGSDTPEWFHMYGWGLHRELQALVKAGLTPHQALTAATVNAAAFMGASREWGTIEAGKRADLVLLTANPLDDISNTLKIDAVSAGGRWLSRPELDAMISKGAQIITGSAPPLPSRSNDWLALLPDGEEKRSFILDCTGCHQLDERMTRNGDRARSREEWVTSVNKMLGFAGATTGFPIISASREAESTAAWVSQHLNRLPPVAAPRVASAEVTEFPISAPGDLPHDVAVDSRGRVIVTGMFSHVLYALDPSNGRIDTLAIPVPNANPRAVDIGSDGTWWVALGGPRSVVSYEPASNKWTTHSLGYYPHSVAVDSSGGVWANGHFTKDPELVSRVDPKSGEKVDFTMPKHPTLGDVAGGPIPYEIRVSPKGQLWLSELRGNRLLSVDPATRKVESYDMPVSLSGPRRFDIDRNGILWIPAYANNALVRLDPATREFRSFTLPMRDALPYVARINHTTGRVWLGTGAADAVLEFDPAAGTFRTFSLPTRGALVRHLAVNERTGEVWVAYGESPGKASSRIARIRPTQ